MARSGDPHSSLAVALPMAKPLEHAPFSWKTVTKKFKLDKSSAVFRPSPSPIYIAHGQLLPEKN
jgi:hypothetical protein